MSILNINIGCWPGLNYFCKTENDVCIFPNMNPSNASKAKLKWTGRLGQKHGSWYHTMNPVGPLWERDWAALQTHFRYSVELGSQDFYWCFQVFIKYYVSLTAKCMSSFLKKKKKAGENACSHCLCLCVFSSLTKNQGLKLPFFYHYA